MQKSSSTAVGCLALIGIALFLWTIFSLTGNDEEPKILTREEKIKQLFSAWDGSLPALTKIIKDSMNDPNSYEHVETGYWDMDDHLVVHTTFRGKNAFGGVVKNWVKAKVDLNGNVLEIMEQGP